LQKLIQASSARVQALENWPPVICISESTLKAVAGKKTVKIIAAGHEAMFLLKIMLNTLFVLFAELLNKRHSVVAPDPVVAHLIDILDGSVTRLRLF